VPSLRVYLVSKALGAPIVDVMGDDYALFRELEAIVDADARAEARRHARQNKASRGGHRGRRR
jgi:hypothetical protein